MVRFSVRISGYAYIGDAFLRWICQALTYVPLHDFREPVNLSWLWLQNAPMVHLGGSRISRSERSAKAESELRAFLSVERFQIEKIPKMKLRKLLVVVVLAFLAAAAIGYESVPMSYPEKLIRIQVAQGLGKIDKRIADEPLAVQALLLDYAGDAQADVNSGRTELVLKAWIALLKYRAQSREVLQLYGTEPKFQVILREYGEAVIPVIKYFLDNDIASIKLMSQAGAVVTATMGNVGDAVDEARKTVENWWNKLNGRTPAPTLPPRGPAAPQPTKVAFGPMQRGLYAINSISSDGHKFLGQFSLDATNVAHWSQVDRTTTTVTSFLTSGLSSLERKYELDEKIGSSDVFFAAVDVLPFVLAVKLLKAGKVVAATGKELSVVSKTRVFAARLIPRNPLLVSMGKYGVLLATGYVVLSHPSLLNSVFAEVAKLMGLNAGLVQFLGWFLLISIALYPFSWLLRIFVNLLSLGFSWLERSMKSTPVRLTAKPSTAGAT